MVDVPEYAGIPVEEGFYVAVGAIELRGEEEEEYVRLIWQARFAALSLPLRPAPGLTSANRGNHARGRLTRAPTQVRSLRRPSSGGRRTLATYFTQTAARRLARPPTAGMTSRRRLYR